VFSILDLGADGHLVASTDDAHVAPPPPGTMRWIDLVGTSPDALSLLRSRFEFHPLAIEDCASFGLQSKVDDYDRYLFVVIHAFTAAAGDPSQIQIHEIHAFVGESFLVTVHDNPFTDHERVWEQARSDPRHMERGPGWILYRHIDAMIDGTEPLVLRLRDQLDDLEAHVSEGGLPDLTHVFRIKRSTVAMRRVIRPLRDTIGILYRRADERISQRVALHLRDVADHVGRLADLIEELREVSAGIVAGYQAVQTCRCRSSSGSSARTSTPCRTTARSGSGSCSPP
jgi:magnesium transporter